MAGDLVWLTKRPIAHRGLHDGNKACWENTLSAFQAAIDEDYAIECDVRLSADKVPVVFHDAGLERLTGREGKLSALTSSQIEELHIGGTEDKVPSVKALLDLVGGRVPLIIELKGERGSDDGLVAAMVELLATYKGSAALMSFDHWLIREMQKSSGDIPIGLTAEGTTKNAFDLHRTAMEGGVDFVSYNVKHLPNAFIKEVHDSRGLPVITWTVRNVEDAELTYKYADQITFEGFRP